MLDNGVVLRISDLFLIGKTSVVFDRCKALCRLRPSIDRADPAGNGKAVYPPIRTRTGRTSVLETPEFRKTNYIISSVWAAAFAVMVLAELAILFLPHVSQRLGIIVIVLALVGAVEFTGWYPSRLKQ